MPETDDIVLTEAELATALKALPGWEIRDGWLRRTFATPGWTHSILLVNTIALVAEAGWHHPDLVVGYVQVTVKLQTHRVKGLTNKDVELAHRIEEVVLWKPPEGHALPGFPKKWIQ